MTNYEGAKVKLTELRKLKSAVKNNAGTNLRITQKKFQDGELPYELFLTIRHKTKLRNAFECSFEYIKQI